jgi:hypothetical protein
MGGACQPLGFDKAYEEVVLKKTRTGKTAKKSQTLCRRAKTRAKKPLVKQRACRRKIKRLRLRRSAVRAGRFRWRYFAATKSGSGTNAVLQFWLKPSNRRVPNMASKGLLVGQLPLGDLVKGMGYRGWPQTAKYGVVEVYWARGFKNIAVLVDVRRRPSSVGGYMENSVWLGFRPQWDGAQHKAVRPLVKTASINGRLASMQSSAAPQGKRRCRKDSDCVLRPRFPCSCPSCGQRIPSAINRKGLKRLRHVWARMRCKRPPCRPCRKRHRSLRYTFEAVCKKRLCRVRFKR